MAGVGIKNDKGEIRKLFFTLFIILLSLQITSVNSETLVHASQSDEIIVALNDAVISEIAAFKTDPCLQPDDFHLYPDRKHL